MIWINSAYSGQIDRNNGHILYAITAYKPAGKQWRRGAWREVANSRATELPHGGAARYFIKLSGE